MRGLRHFYASLVLATAACQLALDLGGASDEVDAEASHATDAALDEQQQQQDGDAPLDAPATAIDAGPFGMPTTIATGVTADAVASDFSFVYWVDPSPTAAKGVYRVAKASGTPAVVFLDSTILTLSNLLVSGDHAYFEIDDACNRVKRAPIPMGTSEVYPAFGNDCVPMDHIAVDTTHLYVARGTSIDIQLLNQSSPPKGPERFVNASASSPSLLAPTPSVVYALEPLKGEVQAYEKPHALKWRVASEQNSPVGLAADAQQLYWVDKDGVVKTIGQNADAGPPRALNEAGASTTTTRMATSPRWIVWSGGTWVAAIDKSGGAPVVIASGEGEIRGLAADEDGVYWSTLGTSSDPGTIRMATAARPWP